MVKGRSLCLHLRCRRRQQRGGFCAHDLRLLTRLLRVALLDKWWSRLRLD